MPLHKFADAHATPSQRYFNVLCLAYGADKELFADFVSKGVSPKSAPKAATMNLPRSSLRSIG